MPKDSAYVLVKGKGETPFLFRTSEAYEVGEWVPFKELLDDNILTGKGRVVIVIADYKMVAIIDGFQAFDSVVDMNPRIKEAFVEFLYRVIKGERYI
jgi:hypothetical protein